MVGLHGQLSHGHQVGGMEHGSLMQGHRVGALVEVSWTSNEECQGKDVVQMDLLV